MKWQSKSFVPAIGVAWYGSAYSWAEVALVRVAKGLPLGDLQDINDIFGNADLAAHAYVYLCRRFGPPPSGFDEYKTLGCWYLTTPKKDLIIGVYPKAASVGVSLLTSGAAADHWKPTTEVRDAVIAALRDLLRPVGIRDQWRNVAGLCEPRFRGDKVVDEVARFKWAGRGVLPEYWERFAAGRVPLGE